MIESRQLCRDAARTLVLVVFCLGILGACQQPDSAQPSDPAPSQDPSPAAVRSWYQDFGQKLTLESMESRALPPVSLLPLGKAADRAAVDQVQYPTARDQAAMLATREEGIDSQTGARIHQGAVTPLTFVHRELDQGFWLNQVQVTNQAERSRLLSFFYPSFAYVDAGLDSLIPPVLEDGDVYLVDGVEVRDYTSETVTYRLNRPVEPADGDRWLSQVVAGYQRLQAAHYQILSWGGHSREEVILAIRLKEGIGRPLTPLEDVWMKWVIQPWYEWRDQHEELFELTGTEPAQVKWVNTVTLMGLDPTRTMDEAKVFAATGPWDAEPAVVLGYASRPYAP